jgi:hypothetical protein
VTRILAGTNVTIFPTSGEGEVTINAAGGGGGGVTSVTASGPGIGATPTTGAVVLTNTGVTSVAAGAGMTVSAPTGDLTVTNSGVTSLVAGPGITVSGGTGAVTVSAVGFPPVVTQTFDYIGDEITFNVTGNSFRISVVNSTGNMFTTTASLSGWLSRTITLINPTWDANTVVIVSLGGGFRFGSGPVGADNYLSGQVACGLFTGSGDFTRRRLIMSGAQGAGGQIPTGLGGFSGEAAIYGWVVRGVP